MRTLKAPGISKNFNNSLVQLIQLVLDLVLDLKMAEEVVQQVEEVHQRGPLRFKLNFTQRNERLLTMLAEQRKTEEGELVKKFVFQQDENVWEVDAVVFRMYTAMGFRIFARWSPFLESRAIPHRHFSD